jgi:hypothetical protein
LFGVLAYARVVALPKFEATSAPPDARRSLSPFAGSKAVTFIPARDYSRNWHIECQNAQKVVKNLKAAVRAL